jgi:hypothetical protein
VTRSRWIVIAVIAIGLFAIVVGGFLWPRPQFRKGPWTGAPPVESFPADSG